MGVGPLVILDKSALESLDTDESVWLDAFFLVNVVPFFYVEVLADLEKELRHGRSQDAHVAALAAKTPSGAVPNIYHRRLISQELWGAPVAMKGFAIIDEGETVRDGTGSVGVRVEGFDEATMLERWKSREFSDDEREIAKRWRSDLAEQDLDETIARVGQILPAETRISDLSVLKGWIDRFLECASAEVFRLVLEIAGLPEASIQHVFGRWAQAGCPPVTAFAPFTSHVASVDILFYLGIQRGFISGDRPSNTVDMAYLYYLPFAMVFTSQDRLHRLTAPLFLRADQSFIWGPDIKAALAELDAYHDRLPDEVKRLGVMGFAHWPPTDLTNAVTQLWDKHMPGWRAHARTPQQVFERRRESAEGITAGELSALVDGARPLGRDVDHDDLDFMVIKREVPLRKGKWLLLPEELADTSDDG